MTRREIAEFVTENTGEEFPHTLYATPYLTSHPLSHTPNTSTSHPTSDTRKGNKTRSSSTRDGFTLHSALNTNKSCRSPQQLLPPRHARAVTPPRGRRCRCARGRCVRPCAAGHAARRAVARPFAPPPSPWPAARSSATAGLMCSTTSPKALGTRSSRFATLLASTGSRSVRM